MLLQAGMDAPQFELFDADMEMFSLAAQCGKKNVVLYFYPKDGTPGCTMEANEFSDLDDKFKQLGTLVVGVSRDECLSHAEFRDKYGFSVLLLSDPESVVCEKYGVLNSKEACPEHGRSADTRKTNLVQRSTFVIDKKGQIRHALYGVHAHGHADEILDLIRKLK